FFSELDKFNPVGRPIRSVLLIKAFAVNPVRKANQRQRASLYVGKQGRGNPEIILDHLGLHDVVFREQHFLQVGDLQLALSNLHHLLLAHARKLRKLIGHIGAALVGEEDHANDKSDGSNSDRIDRKSTRLDSSHLKISYAVFCLKKKKI